MILLIDNYDSFSYNLYQLIGSVRRDIQVIRNDEMTVSQIGDLAPDAIFLSPGPGHPRDAGVCMEVVKTLGKTIPIFGVCLGHQAICEAFGGTVTYASRLMHGKTSMAKLSPDSKLFATMGDTLQVARYHSLSGKNLPDCLRVTAMADDGDIMAVEHIQYPVFGVQFHPESILTVDGKTIIENFLEGVNHD